MKAQIVRWEADNYYDPAVGDEIEVIGFGYQPMGLGGSELRAIWRDDLGHVWDIDVSAIRMLPNTAGPIDVDAGSVKVPA